MQKKPRSGCPHLTCPPGIVQSAAGPQRLIVIVAPAQEGSAAQKAEDSHTKNTRETAVFQSSRLPAWDTGRRMVEEAVAWQSENIADLVVLRVSLNAGADA